MILSWTDPMVKTRWSSCWSLPHLLSSTLRIYARLLQTQAQKFAASETMRTACSTEGCHRYRSKGILERAEFINVPARPG
jgi:hypothetical protein